LGGPVYDHSLHDWHSLFGRMGILEYDHFISGYIWTLAVLSMLLCFSLGIWLLWQMAFYKTAKKL
ncbi:MAG: hypothetical protein WCH62_08510, partial [Candidatus Omnitrophota bacterium]